MSKVGVTSNNIVDPAPPKDKQKFSKGDKKDASSKKRKHGTQDLRKESKVKFFSPHDGSMYDMSNTAVGPSGEYLSFVPSSMMDTTETVGVQRMDIDIGDLDTVSLSNIHPCMFCNVTLKHGVMILAIFEIVVWTLCLAACIVALAYWMDQEGKGFILTLGSTPYSTSNSEQFKLLQNAFIVQTSFCASFAILGVILLIGGIRKNSYLCTAWLISIAIMTVGRIIAAILLNVNFMRYGLFYLLIRPFQVWCVWVYRNSARRKEIRHGKAKYRKRKSKTPDLVPVTYYGVMANVPKLPDMDRDDRTIKAGDGTSDKSYPVKYVQKPTGTVKKQSR